MKFTLSWLKRHIKTDARPDEIAETLTSLGIEVEEIIDKGLIYKSFVIAEIMEAVQHPNAEKLKVCKVNDGKSILQIVCGASNARSGIKVVLAPISAVIPLNSMIIKEAKMRDVVSYGMLCSYEELCIPIEDKGNIIELPADSPVGSSFAEYANLNEVIFDISITPNRGDIASLLGIARDLAVKKIGMLIKQEIKPVNAVIKQSKEVLIKEPTLCYQFLSREIKDLQNSKNGAWFSKILAGVGYTPKETLIDASNFAMLDMGRPNHIYDLDKLKGNLTIRSSIDGEKFIAIGGTQYDLPGGILVIADEEKIVCVAGVMGGELAKVDINTQSILIEVAVFDPIEVAKAGRALNIHSDSRFRFERRVDNANSEEFMEFLTSIIHSECKGQISDIKRFYGKEPVYNRLVKFNFDKVEKVTGLQISQKHSEEILKLLGFTVSDEGITVPSYRLGDINIEEDLIEEIIRVEGLNSIISASFPLTGIQKQKTIESAYNKIKAVLTHRNINELYTWSFYSQQDAQKFDLSENLKIANSITSELVVMRESIMPNLLKAVAFNEAYGNTNNAFFEMNAVYNDNIESKQQDCLAIVRYGKVNHKNIFAKERDIDFFDIKADLYAAIESYGFDPEKLLIETKTPSYYHPGRSAAFYIGKKLVAYAGELHPQIVKSFDIKPKVVGCELFLEKLPPFKRNIAKEPLNISKFQTVVRDFAFIVSQETTARQIINIIKSVHSFISETCIFDVYKDENLQDKKSVAVTVKIQPSQKTLEENEILEITNQIINKVQNELGANIRR